MLNGTECNALVKLDEGYYISKQSATLQHILKYKKDLLAVVHQLDVPALFIALAAADTKWPNMIRCLGKLKDMKENTEMKMK